ncbi:MAG: hypothetical protein IJ083_01005 [Clostridia bacterium]|nr:hypothetical protein [Clostridia bacterium]
MRKAALLISLLCCLLLCTLSSASAGSPQVSLTDTGLSLQGHEVHYPAVHFDVTPDGADDDTVRVLEETIQKQILEKGHIQDLSSRLAQVLSLKTPLTVTWEGGQTGDLLSLCFTARGPVHTELPEEEKYGLILDLQTGTCLTLQDLLKEGTEEAFCDLLLQEILPALSPQLAVPDLTEGLFEEDSPVSLYATDLGLCLLYPQSRLPTLTGHAGLVCLKWHELRDLLDMSEEGPFVRMGLTYVLKADADTKDRLSAIVADGALPGLPVRLGDTMQEILDTYGLLSDPDEYELGRMVEAEDGRFRGVYLLTDALSFRDFSSSRLDGIRLDSFAVCSLISGETARESCLDLLGSPDLTLTLKAREADAYRLGEGISDYYYFGGNTLCLHFDGQEVLATMTMTLGDR